MTPEFIVGIIFAGIVALGLIGKLIPKSEPKERYFKCSRCRAVSLHTERTKEAWRNRKTKFFCQDCHAEWLKTRRPAGRDAAPFRSTGQSGCLGMAISFVLFPAGAYFLLTTYA